LAKGRFIGLANWLTNGSNGSNMAHNGLNILREEQRRMVKERKATGIKSWPLELQFAPFSIVNLNACDRICAKMQ